MSKNTEYCSNCAHFSKRVVLNLPNRAAYQCNFHKEKATITQPDYQYCGNYINKQVKLRDDKIDTILL